MPILRDSQDNIALADILDGYDGLLLDAFGVLVDGMRLLPGALELLRSISGREYLVVTNDASRLPSTIAERFERLGLSIPEDRILTSGLLIAEYVSHHELDGGRAMVLGTKDSKAYVEDAGLHVCALNPSIDVDCVVVADDDGYPFFDGVDAALTTIVRGVESGRPPALILPNPDIIYPKGPGELGFTSGAVAALLETGLKRRLGPGAPSFDSLGKPNPPIFEAAMRVLSGKLLMVGDQLETDIAGGNRVGLDTALIRTGVSTLAGDTDIQPTYVISRLWR